MLLVILFVQVFTLAFTSKTTVTQQRPHNRCGLPTCQKCQDRRFLSLSTFHSKLPTTRPWEKTWKKIQKVSKLIKTHLHYPKIFSFFFSFCIFLSLFPFFSFLLNFPILPKLLNIQDLWTGQETFTNDGLRTRLCKQFPESHVHNWVRRETWEYKPWW